MPHPTEFQLPPLVDRVREALPGQEIYLVGGAVRDALLGKVSHDLDFAVPDNAIAAARKVADALHADFYILDREFDAARVLVPGTDDPSGGRPLRDVLDFTSFRPAKSSGEGQQGLGADLRGRDFTINAIAYDLRKATILDPLNGAADIRAKTIRVCSPGAMQDDAIRILRGVRLATALEFHIEIATRTSMREAVPALPGISPERQRDELFKILDGRRPDAAVRALEMLGVFPYVMPELAAMKDVAQSVPHVLDVWEHTLSVIHHLETILDALAPQYDAEKNNDLLTGLLSLRLGRYREQIQAHLDDELNPQRSVRALLFFAALYHDVAKPAMKTQDESGRIRFLGHDAAAVDVAGNRGWAFNLSNDEVGRLQLVLANHMRFHFYTSRMEGEGKQPTRRAIYRFFRDTGEAGVDLVLLGLADLRGTRGPTITQETWTSALDVARILLENYWERPQEAVAPPKLLDGNEVMQELQMAPGPVLGELLRAIQEAQATGEVGTRAEAVRFAHQWVRERGSTGGLNADQA